MTLASMSRSTSVRDQFRQHRMLAGQLLAALSGVIWFAALIFGGLGFIFGPLAWGAAIIGRRWPLVSASLLLGPSALLGFSWLTTFLAGASLVQLPIPIILIGPPVIAARLIVHRTATVR